MKKILILAVCTMLGTLFAWSEPQKKLLYAGWVVPGELYLFDVPAEKFEQDIPCDGIGIRPVIEIKRDGKTVEYNPSRNKSSSPIVLQKEDFKEWVDVLQKLKFKKLTHNFFLLNTSQFSADWFDDAAWEKSLNNHRMIAWFTKTVGFKGIMFDCEGYPTTDLPFAYHSSLGKSIAETEKKVRERGAEWIKAVASEYPDITLLCYIWAGDIFGNFYDRQEPDTVNATLYLLRAFINGVYDALPETVKIIDGNEDPGYHSASEADFDKAIADFRCYSRRIIAPENRTKYYAQTQLAYSFYLDSYMPGNRYPWNIWTKHPSPLRLLQENITRSFARTDEYVWIWGEKGTFFPKLFPGHAHKPWDVRLPGLSEAIWAGRNPIAAAKKYAGKNLLKNSSMQADPSGQNIHNWFKWQGKKSKGVLKGENGGALLQNVVNGSFNQDHKTVKVGERYLLTGKVKVIGNTVVPNLTINYYDGKGIGHWRIGRKAIFGPPDKDGWRHGAVLADIPDGHDVKFIRIGFGSSAPCTGETPNGFCFFDDVELRLVQYPWDKK